MRPALPGERASEMRRCPGWTRSGAFLDPEGLDQSWNASEFVYGTSDWREVYMDFVPDTLGEATICCGLGFPWGTYNGGKASGTVWWDDIRVGPAPDESVYTRESEHIVLN